MNASREGWDKSFWKTALGLAVALRALYTLLAAGISLVQPTNLALIRSNALTEGLARPSHGVQYLLLGCWERFDTLWYLRVAARGYDLPPSTVFFPLYPGLIRMGSYVSPPIVAALLISTAAFFFLLWGFYEVLREQLPASVAETAVWLMAFWPGSFIFLAGYAEALLLALIVWSLIMGQRGRWAYAAGLGFAAALTKAAGVVVFVPLLVIAIRRRQVSAWPILTVFLGPVAFLGWLHATGHESISRYYQQYWHTSPAVPWHTLRVAAEVFSQRPNALLAVNFGALIICCALAMSSRMKPEFIFYAVAVVGLCLTKMTDPPLQSMQRYALILFPVYVGLARWLQPWFGHHPDHRRFRERFVLACAFAGNVGLLWLFLGWSLVL